MRRKPQTCPGRKKDPAAILVRLLQPEVLIPPAFKKWHVVIESLLEEFLRHFDPETLSRLLKHQRALSVPVSPGIRAERLASELTAFHKVCQMIARNPSLSVEVRAALAPLEQLPPVAIPDENLAAALALAARWRPGLCPWPGGVGVARGSVADVFRFSGGLPCGVALKMVRPDAMPRIHREASILKQMSGKMAMTGALSGDGLARTLAGALQDAGGALLREIDFAGEAANMRAAHAFYELNRRVRVPMVMGSAPEEGIFMEFIESSPLLDSPLDESGRPDIARLVFRTLILEPLFSGLPETIFHADPHAGNIHLQMHKGDSVIVLLDWSQAGRLAAPRRHALLELCLHCATGGDVPPGVLKQLLGAALQSSRIRVPEDAANPLRAALEIVGQLAERGHPVPLDLLLLRKSLLTVEGVVHQLNPGFDPWRETLVYASWVLASEAAMRAWAVPFPWLDQPAYLRSGLPTRILALHASRVIQKKFVQTHNFC